MNPDGPLLALCGSLRQVSSNRAALEALRSLAPAALELEIYPGLGWLPLFSPDLEAAGLPPVVAELRQRVEGARGLVIACPEYAHGIPGAFKNLLDWLVGSERFPGTPVLLLNCSGRESHHAQEALTEVLRTMSARLLTGQPLPVRLPGAGCAPAQVLDDPARRGELEAALACLATMGRS